MRRDTGTLGTGTLGARTAGFGVMAVLGVAMVGLQAAGQSPQQAESLARKVALIQAQADVGPRPSRTPISTTLSEGEVNAWFAYHAPPLLPEGLTRPRVTIVGDRKVIGTAIVDLDAIARSRASGRTFDLWNLIGGRVPVTVAGLLHADNGWARLEVQEADISGVAVPLRVLEELVQYYSRTPESPAGIRLTDSFELPAGIRQVRLQRGAAVVVQ
jgi:hypothetical protein